MAHKCNQLQNRANVHTAFFNSQNLGASIEDTNLADAFKQTGGGFEMNDSLHLKGRPSVQYYEGCGQQNESNLGASSLPSPMFGGAGNTEISYSTGLAGGDAGTYYGYTGDNDLYEFRGGRAPVTLHHKAQCGGRRKRTRKSNICRKIGKVRTHSQVKFFWSFVCSDFNKLYRKCLKNKEKKSPKEVKQFVKKCTQALCCAVSATKATSFVTCRKRISKMKHHLKLCSCILKTLGIKRHNLKSLENKLIRFIKQTRMRSGCTKKKHTKCRHRRTQGAKKRRKRKNKGTRRRTSQQRKPRRQRGSRRVRRRRQRGGYKQHGSNQANTPSYSIATSSKTSALANPPPIAPTDNCRNFYNHYSK